MYAGTSYASFSYGSMSLIGTTSDQSPGVNTITTLRSEPQYSALELADNSISLANENNLKHINFSEVLNAVYLDNDKRDSINK